MSVHMFLIDRPVPVSTGNHLGTEEYLRLFEWEGMHDFALAPRYRTIDWTIDSTGDCARLQGRVGG